MHEILRENGIEPIPTACIQGLNAEQTTERIKTLTRFKNTLMHLLNRLPKNVNGNLTNEVRNLVRECDIAIMWHKDSLQRLEKYPYRLREKSELGERFTNRTFENLDHKIDIGAFNYCRAYAKNFGKARTAEKNGIILSGGVGIGKTHLASAIANKIIDEQRTPVFFQNVPTMYDRIKKEFGKSDFTTKTAKKVELLVLDDLGKEKRTDWTDERLYEIVNARYERKLPIIVTTNLSAEEMTERLDYSVSSRLAEMCRFIPMQGEDRRL